MTGPLEGVGEHQARIARNEAAFRETNEQIEALNEAGGRLSAFHIVCECGDSYCADTLTIRAAEYEGVRAHPDRFLLKPGHEETDVERVVERHAEFVVVEKIPGAAREITRLTDPRSATGGMDAETARRIAQNEARFRTANERIEDAHLRLEPAASTLPFVCECGRTRCMKILRLTVEDYERVRSNPRHFLCSPGHAIVGENLGRVVCTTETFVVVEKTGEAGEVAMETDPRSAEDPENPA